MHGVPPNGGRAEAAERCVAMRDTSTVLKNDVWPDDTHEVAKRLRSAVAVATFATSSPDLHEDHRKRLLNEAIWFWTERGSVSRKYKLRYRTPDALALQHQIGFSAAAKGLAHEHVHERAAVVAKLLNENADVEAVLVSAEACVVTKAEHKLLSSVKGVFGWRRYVHVGLQPVDMHTGEPLDLRAAVAAEAMVWDAS